MHNIRLSDGGVAAAGIEAPGFIVGSLVPGAGVLRLEATTGTTFILATVIDRKVAKTKASFLAFEAVDIWRRNAFSNHSSSRSPGLGLV